MTKVEQLKKMKAIAERQKEKILKGEELPGCAVKSIEEIDRKIEELDLMLQDMEKNDGDGGS